MVSFTISLFVIGMLGLFIFHATKLSDIIRENIEIQVFLEKDLPDATIDRLKKALLASKFIKSSTQLPGVVFISKEQAANQLTRETGEDFMNFLGDNPLRDVLLIKIHPEFSASETLKRIKLSIEKQEGVFEVVYRANVIENIEENITKISIVLSFIGISLLVIVFLLINNTIKLALYSQRFLIRSMQLVGATGWFIQKPFLMRAFVHGMLAGLFASLALILVLSYGYTYLEGLSNLANPEHILFLFLGLIFMGGLVGLISSFQSVQKYLYTSLDDLY